MTVWAYYRVSTEKQDYENQKVGVIEYAKRAGLTIDREIIDEGVSGTVAANKRKFKTALYQSKAGDTIITSELSRLGRSTTDVIHTCNLLVKKQVRCYLVKQGITIDNSPMGKMLIAIFAAFSEMERDLLSMRTKEALARKKAAGIKLGKPFGSRNKSRLIDKVRPQLISLYDQGVSARKASKVLNCSSTMVQYMWKELGLVSKRRGNVVIGENKNG